MEKQKADITIKESGVGANGLVARDILIPSGDPGIRLFLRNKRPLALDHFRGERTLLFVHGAAQPAETTFDLPAGGMSWMDYIASRGWDVWLVDIRGFGRSTKPPEMELPPDEAPPVARTEVAWRDFDAAASHIMGARGIGRLNVLGWSWGTVISGGWASRNPDKIEKIVLFGPSWRPRPYPSPVIPGYVRWTIDDALVRIQTGAPEEQRKSLMPPDWYRIWSAATLETDDQAARFDPPQIRSPAGFRTDCTELAASGRRFYDPTLITAPTLLIRGAWDELTHREGALALFDALGNAREKRYVEIGGATHFAHLEINRMRLFEEVQGFLEEDHL